MKMEMQESIGEKKELKSFTHITESENYYFLSKESFSDLLTVLQSFAF